MNKLLSPLQTEHLTGFDALDRTAISLHVDGDTSVVRATCKIHHLRAACASYQNLGTVFFHFIYIYFIYIYIYIYINLGARKPLNPT